MKYGNTPNFPFWMQIGSSTPCTLEKFPSSTRPKRCCSAFNLREVEESEARPDPNPRPSRCIRHAPWYNASHIVRFAFDFLASTMKFAQERMSRKERENPAKGLEVAPQISELNHST